VEPDSGAPGYDGPQAASSPDPFVYRPDVDAPRHPGLLARAQRRFISSGLEAPWYPVLGNHDVLVQGEAAPSPALDGLATGGQALVEADDGLDLPESFDAEAVDRLLAGGLPGRTVPVPADARRDHPTADEVVGRLRDASGSGGSGQRMDYSYDVGPRLRVLTIDAVRREGGSDGRVLPEQVDWLRGEIARAGERWVIVVSHQPLVSSKGGDAALALLDASPAVVAAVAGHTHESSIEPRRTRAGGFWLIGTPSLADFPQQARALRLVETAGGVAIETWMVDTAPGDLSDTARELAFLDAQGGRPQSAGARADRNARLFLKR
jgi:3',5'-cyclic AMP phosphodiesterase CpdA